MRGSQLSRRVAKPDINDLLKSRRSLWSPTSQGRFVGSGPGTHVRLFVTCFLIAISHLRQIGSAPQVTTPETRTNPWKFQTVWVHPVGG